MLQRKSHKRSKNGCLPCKRQHIKCDEVLPICFNCVRRDVECVYKDSKKTPHGEPSLTIQNMDTLDIQRACSNCLRPNELTQSHGLLEMELMHRWSVHTWKGFCCIEQEQTLMQDELPRIALKHPFLLHGMLSAAALDIAMSYRNDTSKAEHYGKIALWYYNKGSAQFRQQLTCILPEMIHLLYLHASIGAYVSFAIPPTLAWNSADGPTTLVHRGVTFFNMATGLMNIMTAYKDGLEQTLKSVRVVRDLVSIVPSHSTSEDDEKALQDLMRILRTARLKCGKNTSAMHDLYKKCMNHLYLCFEVWSCHIIKGYFLSFPCFSGTQFVAALISADPYALLILMYWGVLLHRSRKEFWWIGSLGNKVVREVASLVLTMPLGHDSTVQEAVSWAVRQTE